MTFWKIKSGSLSVDLEKADKLVKRLAINRKLPKYLLKNELEVSEKFGLIPCHTMIDGSKKGFSSTTQFSFIENTLSNPYWGNPLILIGVDDVESRAFTLASSFFLESIRQHLKNPKLHPNTPLWHPVYGGWKDKLRDDDNYRASIGKFGILFITNIAVNSTYEKIEKVRDLIHMFVDIPRIVVYSGGDPLEWSKDTLFIRPNRAIYLGNRSKPPKKIQL